MLHTIVLREKYPAELKIINHYYYHAPNTKPPSPVASFTNMD